MRGRLIPSVERLGLAITTAGREHPAPYDHPENAKRLDLIVAKLGEPQWRERRVDLPSHRYSRQVLERIHDPSHLDRMAEFEGDDYLYFDPDTYAGPESFEASCRVTWALLSAVDATFESGPYVSFVLGRPPGHHAGHKRSMGFCLVNHIAVAAQYALDEHGAARVAVVDFDIHHGNGTQDLFYDRADVLYVSTHQYPFYPGTGAAMEAGRETGEGYTLNFPLPAGSDDTAVVSKYDGPIAKKIQDFQPELILVSAGFDAHRFDPLGGFRMTGEGFGRIGRILKELADESCEGRLVSVLEGGYDPEGNLDSITHYLEALID